MKISIFVIAFLFCCVSVFSQNESESARLDVQMPNANIYFEAGASGLFNSINYEWVWRQDTNDFTALRVGAGVMPVNGFMKITLPVTYTILYCFSQRSSIEYGIGGALSLGNIAVENSLIITNGLDEKYYLSGMLGYRFQSSKNIVAGARFTPLMAFAGTSSMFQLWGGVFIGDSIR